MQWCTTITASDIDAHGTGHAEDCRVCRGTGHPVDVSRCTDCQGSGVDDGHPCELCEGRMVVYLVRPDSPRCMAAVAALAAKVIAEE